MSTPSGTSFKTILGYTVVLILFIGTIYYVVDLTRRLTDERDSTERLMASKDDIDRLLMELIECQNAAQAATLGSSEDIAHYHVTLDSTLATIAELAAGDSMCRPQLDSLAAVLALRRDNVLEIASLLTGRNEFEAYNRDIGRIVSEGDTAVAGQTVTRTVTTHKEVVVSQPRRNFFQRMADVFRPGRRDTIESHTEAETVAVDTLVSSRRDGGRMTRNINEVNRDMSRRMAERSRRMAEQTSRVRREGVELNRRLATLMNAVRESRAAALEENAKRIEAERGELTVTLSAIALTAVFWVLVLIFVTRRDEKRARRYRDDLEQARDRAEEIADSREKLLLTIAHNIKAPAAAISGYSRLLKGTRLSDTQRLDVECIGGSANHLTSLVGMLLDYSKLERGAMPLKLMRFRPAALLRAIAADFAPTAAEERLKMVTEIEVDDNETRVSDPVMLRQIIDNLMSNAIKYTREGSVGLTGRIDGDGELEVSVTDTGAGMTEEEQSRVFDEWVRLDGSHGSEGAGLGLTVSLKMAHLLGGTIEVTSAKGRGSRFTLRVPTTAAGESALPTYEIESADEPTEIAGDKDARIIAVDDDPVQLRLTMASLRRAGFESVTGFSTAASALEAVKAEAPDILITDLRMPVTDGYSLARQVKEIAPGCRVIALTANAEGTSEPSDYIDTFLSKPLDARRVAADGDTDVRLDALTEFADGDEEAAREILATFFGQCRVFVEELTHALEDKDTARAAETAHKMLPTFKSINAASLPSLEALNGRRGAKEFTGDDSRAIKAAIASAKSILSSFNKRAL